MSISSSPVTGRLATDPDLSFSKDGKPIARYTIVTSGRKKNRNTDQWEDVDVSWWKCTSFDQLAEAIYENLHKGDAVLAGGTFSQDNWTDKDGNNRTSLKGIVNNIGADLRWAKRKDLAANQTGTKLPADHDTSEVPF